MNTQERDILITLYEKGFSNQRDLSHLTGHSLGVVNRSLHNLVDEGYLDDRFFASKKAKTEIESKSPKNAIILAAGFGMRMVPINTQTPKGLIEVRGEPLIERLIKQLHQKGVLEIHIVVGFMKDQFEYLIDKYDVDLIVNEEYFCKNNLHSLYLASQFISNTYIVPCDIWSKENPFSNHELYSWYMVSDKLSENSYVRVNRKMELVSVSDSSLGNSMIGISYVSKEVAGFLRSKLSQYDKDRQYSDSFWEETLFTNGRMAVSAKVVDFNATIEINTYEQLREFDSNSNHLKSDALKTISEALNVDIVSIKGISVLKKGMTNRSFLFGVNNKKYIMRIPGEGTSKLIDRRKESDVYATIKGKGICDDVVYIDSEKGYKITEYLEGSRVCDPGNVRDLETCMSLLRTFHGFHFKVDHEFDIFGQIDFYEALWNGKPSVYRDYKETKKKVFLLKDYIASFEIKKVLTHIDAVPDNFLFTSSGDVRLIDWEYAGMQDPHVDIAMFCIYSLYDREDVDRLIDIYFEGDCQLETRIKIYSYISACGLLWSNWCEYKRSLGVEFGEYSLRQYRYAKDYYRIVEGLLNKNA